MNRPPPIMEPEDEIRALKTEVVRLRKALHAVENQARTLQEWCLDPGGYHIEMSDLYAIEEEARAALNPAKSA